MSKKSTVAALAAVMMTASTLGFAGFALASTTTPSPATSWKTSQKHIKTYLKTTPGIIGTVSAVNGNTITLTSKNNTVYTVDASTAKIVKNRNTIIIITDIKVGDTITVKSSDIKADPIIATTIFDGKPIKPMKKIASHHKGVLNKATTVQN